MNRTCPNCERLIKQLADALLQLGNCRVTINASSVHSKICERLNSRVREFCAEHPEYRSRLLPGGETFRVVNELRSLAAALVLLFVPTLAPAATNVVIRVDQTEVSTLPCCCWTNAGPCQITFWKCSSTPVLTQFDMMGHEWIPVAESTRLMLSNNLLSRALARATDTGVNQSDCTFSVEWRP